MVAVLDFRRIALALCLILVVALAGCQGSSGASQSPPADAQRAPGGKTGAPLPNAPAVVEPTATSLAKNTPTPQGKELWRESSRTLDGVTFSYRYPPGWNEDLSYCAPEANQTGQQGMHLQSGCASTDILVGQKARDVGQLTGEELTIDSKRAVKQLDVRPSNGLTSRIYTLMIYGSDGAPLFGFSTSIGYGTTPERQEWITTQLDLIADSIRVEKKP